MADPDSPRGLPARDHAGALHGDPRALQDALDRRGRARPPGPHLDTHAGLRLRARPDRPPLGRARGRRAVLHRAPDRVPGHPLRPDGHRDRPAGRLRGGRRLGDAQRRWLGVPPTGERLEWKVIIWFPWDAGAAPLPRREGLRLRDPDPGQLRASPAGSRCWPGRIVAEREVVPLLELPDALADVARVAARGDRPEGVGRLHDVRPLGARRRVSVRATRPTAKAARRRMRRNLPNMCSPC